MVHWVLQDKITSCEDLKALQKAFKKHKCTYQVVQVIPFDDELPDITPTCQHVIAYGSTIFTQRVYHDGSWAPGVYFDEDKFKPSYWNSLLGNHSLNRAGSVVTLGELPEKMADGKPRFVRPNDDSKLFPGQVLDITELIPVVRFGDPDIPIWLALPVNIKTEWRLFVVNHQIVTGSQYRKNGRLNVKKSVPKTAMNFAQQMVVRLCTLGGTYVLDVCETADAFKVVEVGCLNAAGFYACDINKIVKAVVDMELTSKGQSGSLVYN